MAEKKEMALIVQDEQLPSFIRMDEYLEVVNQAPPQGIIKNHPTAKGVKYLPIDKVELMLDKMYQQWYVEVLDTKQLLNSVAVTIRLFYLHPLTDKWTHQDGVGAATIQTDKGKNASDLGAIKHDAIQKALPAAKSAAIKDAAHHIGKVFGRDLNRSDVLEFTPSYGTDTAKAKQAVLEGLNKDKNEELNS